MATTVVFGCGHEGRVELHLIKWAASSQCKRCYARDCEEARDWEPRREAPKPKLVEPPSEALAFLLARAKDKSTPIPASLAGQFRERGKGSM